MRAAGDPTLITAASLSNRRYAPVPWRELIARETALMVARSLATPFAWLLRFILPRRANFRRSRLSRHVWGKSIVIHGFSLNRHWAIVRKGLKAFFRRFSFRFLKNFSSSVHLNKFPEYIEKCRQTLLLEYIVGSLINNWNALPDICRLLRWSVNFLHAVHIFREDRTSTKTIIRIIWIW